MIPVLDILLDGDGDLAVSDTGDIALTQSVRQAILIRLRWFLTEWRLGPGIGVDYWGTILVKNPNLVKVRQAIRNEILSVDEVQAVNYVKVDYNAKTRQTVITYEAVTDEETFREEVKINV